MRKEEVLIKENRLPCSVLRTPHSATGLYLHIPFCHARCNYCDFVTFTGKDDQRDAYIEALSREIELYASVIASERTSEHGKDRERGNPRLYPKHGEIATSALPTIKIDRRPPRNDISTVYFGGGTPSVLEPRHLRVIFSSLRRHAAIDPGAEITLEANPESISAEKLAAWKESGINRLSIGLQAYDNALLKTMGRLHTVEEFCAAYEMSRRHGFSNISIDLIYGFPGQSLEAWKETVISTTALEPEHLSLYALTVEEHTPFGAKGMAVDADRQADMYDWARTYLPTHGYAQYEISNFARSGRECRHNLIYWRGENYVGLGVGAVGCVDGLRWQNHKNMGAYFKDIAGSRLPWASQEDLEASNRKFERLMLGLRLREGYCWAEEDPGWLALRSRLAAEGQLEEIQPGTWRITERYVPLTNQILLPFL